MTKQITIKLKDVYGETKAYPICKDAKLFAEMLGTKTLTRSALGHIRHLGYEIIAVDAFGFQAGKIAA